MRSTTAWAAARNAVGVHVEERPVVVGLASRAPVYGYDQGGLPSAASSDREPSRSAIASSSSAARNGLARNAAAPVDSAMARSVASTLALRTMNSGVGQLGALLDLPDQRQPVAVWQPDVEQDEVDLVRRQERPRGRQVRRLQQGQAVQP